jgi:hypothetical protein
MNSKAIGERSVGLFLARLIQAGYAVSLPFGDNQRYDLIVDDGESLMRAQVKTGRLRHGAVRFNLSSINGFTGKSTHYRGQIDEFLVYCPDTDGYYRVPVDEVGTKEGSLRVDPPKNAMVTGIHWAKDYEF